MAVLHVIADFFCNQIFTGGFLASLFSGLLTSFIFIFVLLYFFRPKLEISDLLLYEVDQLDRPQHRVQYVFKVINYSRFSAFDMKVEVSKKEATPGTNNLINYRATPLQLVKDQYPHVARFRNRKGYSDYALRFRTYDDWTTVLNDPHSTIEVRIICRHELTGLGRVFLKEYTRQKLKPGAFESGNSFKAA